MNNNFLNLASTNSEYFNELQFNYYMPSEFVSLCENNASNIELSIMHLNVRSLHANHDKLVAFMSVCGDVDVIALSEIWSNNVDFYSNLFPGYSMVYELPVKGKAGGVAVFAKNCLNPVSITGYKQHSYSTFESLWLEVSRNNVKYFIGCFYRHPNCNTCDIIDAISVLIDKYKHKKCIILGDFNINLNHYDSNSNVKSYVEEFTNRNFLPFSLLPTRITSESSTLIDHVFSNVLSSNGTYCKAGLLYSDVSDHFANFMIICKNDKQKQKMEKKLIRIYSHTNISAFKNAIDTQNWQTVLASKNVNESLEKFSQIYNNCFESNFPLIRCSNKHNRPSKPWITPALRKSINRKSILHRKWVKTKNKEDERIYKNYARLLRNLIRKSEQVYFHDQLSSKFNNAKDIWKTLNSIGNFSNKKKENNTIHEIKTDRKNITNCNEIAEKFNEYFTTIGDKYSKQFLDDGKKYKSYLGCPTLNSLYLKPADQPEILKIIETLKNSKSTSCDYFSNFLLKECKYSLLTPLLHIFNLSFATGVFPEPLKVTKIIPIYKGGDKLDLFNYRPISLTSSVGKILERLMYNRIVNFFNKSNFFYDYQFGFREGHSTSHAVLELINMIENEHTNNNLILGAFLDLRKAFDLVTRDILLDKLYHYGVRGNAHNWLKSYLLNRPQFTCIGNHSSAPRISNIGLPQGTVLGPLLFLIFINDIKNCPDNPLIKLFADDSNVFVVAKNLQCLFNKANYVLMNINNWFTANRLVLNIEKCNYMIFYPNDAMENSLNNTNLKITINNIQLARCHCIKYLGLFIDDKLKWTNHIDHIGKKLSSLIGLFFRKKYLLPYACRKSLFFAYCYSSIVYCIEVYGNATKTLLNPIRVKCNLILRILQNQDRLCHTKELYKFYNTLPIEQLYQYRVLTLMHSCVYNPIILPNVIPKLFVLNTEVHQYNTRGYNVFNLQSGTSKKSIAYIGPSMWMKLPKHISGISNISQFNRCLKIHLLNCC